MVEVAPKVLLVRRWKLMAHLTVGKIQKFLPLLLDDAKDRNNVLLVIFHGRLSNGGQRVGTLAGPSEPAGCQWGLARH